MIPRGGANPVMRLVTPQIILNPICAVVNVIRLVRSRIS
jgi:hypothetical protein